MPKYLILTEKNSAAKNFAKALGGMSGHYQDFDYEIEKMHGHLMTLAEPKLQIDDVNWADRVSQWSDTSTIPWSLARFNWKRTFKEGKNPMTGRKESTKTDVNRIKKSAQSCDAIVICTDSDKSGEGDLLAFEVIEQIGWKKQVLRNHFADESQAGIRAGFEKLVDVTDRLHYPAFLKAVARERFDYGSMQESRLATKYVRNAGYDVVVRPGRLKSTITVLVYLQTRSRDQFVAKDQYSAIFIDENGNKFKNAKVSKYDQRDLAENDVAQLSTSPVTIGQKERKHQSAPNLLDYNKILTAMVKRGYSRTASKNTYQKMYEASILSYPRPDEHQVNQNQWDQLIPLVPQIAGLVGIDVNDLSNQQARAKYVTKESVSHGANRPGLVVPNSMNEIRAEYKQLGVDLYEIVARSFLATLANDYEYDTTTAFVTKYPKFTAKKSVPVTLGYKTILKNLEMQKKVKKDAKSKNDKPFGTQAKPNVEQGKTTPPQIPTSDFVDAWAHKYGVGTGATLPAVMQALTEGKKAIMKESKSGKLTLNSDGFVDGAVLQHTMLADPKITKQLSQMTDMVGSGKMKLQDIYNALTKIVTTDDKIMARDVKLLDQDSYLADKLPEKSSNQSIKVPMRFNGETVMVKGNFMGHEFTDGEIEALSNGETIQIPTTNKKGIKKMTKGKLEKSKFKGKEYVGFIADWMKK